MNFQKILFTTDFSVASDAGLAIAAAMARLHGATLLMLHVEEAPLAYGAGEYYYGPPEPTSKILGEMLEQLVPEDKSTLCQRRLVVGNPVEEILRVAELEKFDLIVMGTHGRTGVRRMIMGSVAEAVVRRAACPVLTYKMPRKTPADAKQEEKSVFPGFRWVTGPG